MPKHRSALSSRTLVWLAVGAILLTSITAHTLMGVASGWYVPHNDFWPIQFFAARMSLSDPQSLGNGFYPLGAFLWTLWSSEPTRALVLANIALTGLLALGIGIVAARKSMPIAALVVTAVITSDPRWNTYLGAQTADILAACFFGAGAALLFLGASPSQTQRVAATGGLLLGLSAVTRYHFGPASVLLLAAWALVTQHRRAALVAGLAFGPLPLAQALLNRVAGVSMARTQLFNVNKTINDVNWFATSDVELPSSLLQLLTADPLRTLRQVTYVLGDSAPWAAACVVAALLGRETKHRRELAAFALFAVFYVGVMALGSSDRSALALVPIVALMCAVALAECLAERSRAAWLAVALSFIALVTLPTVGQLWRTQLERQRHATELSAVADTVRRETGVVDARRIYTTDIGMYLPGLSPAFPNIPAGWQRFDMYGFRDEYPDICAHTPECFVADLRAAGIEVVLLSPQAR